MRWQTGQMTRRTIWKGRNGSERNTGGMKTAQWVGSQHASLPALQQFCNPPPATWMPFISSPESIALAAVYLGQGRGAPLTVARASSAHIVKRAIYLLGSPGCSAITTVDHSWSPSTKCSGMALFDLTLLVCRSSPMTRSPSNTSLVVWSGWWTA